MTDVLAWCMVLAGPIAIGPGEEAKDGDLIELPKADFDQLSRWGIVREATEAEVAAQQKLAPPEPVAETAAQRKKRLAEEAEATRLAEAEAAGT